MEGRRTELFDFLTTTTNGLVFCVHYGDRTGYPSSLLLKSNPLSKFQETP